MVRQVYGKLGLAASYPTTVHLVHLVLGLQRRKQSSCDTQALTTQYHGYIVYNYCYTTRNSNLSKSPVNLRERS